MSQPELTPDSQQTPQQDFAQVTLINTTTIRRNSLDPRMCDDGCPHMYCDDFTDMNDAMARTSLVWGCRYSHGAFPKSGRQFLPIRNPRCMHGEIDTGHPTNLKQQDLEFCEGHYRK